MKIVVFDSSNPKLSTTVTCAPTERVNVVATAVAERFAHVGGKFTLRDGDRNVLAKRDDVMAVFGDGARLVLETT